ncbi:MAG: SAM-dependent methyltransferase [Anaerolineales bacterium]|nr:SAM-dependent methyltransferase [Anaerolineales bacterium]
MRKSQFSITAQGIALMRAMEFEKPEGARICNDSLAGKFIDPFFYWFGKCFAGLAERRSPGVIGFMTARCRYMDDFLNESLAGGIAQLVILGAGLDSRAYRFGELKGRVRVFEVDHPATQSAKIGRVIKIFGNAPDHVTYVPIDFNAEDLQKLISAGYNPAKKTLFIWEGVTPYLTAEAVDRTLAFVAHNSVPGSSVVFDYIYAAALSAKEKRGEIKRMERARRVTGEGLTFGIDQGKIGEFLRARGFDRIVDITSEDLHAKYFTGANRARAIAPIYAIAQATVAGN